MSISNFLKEKIETKDRKSVNDLKKYRKPVKIVENRVCQFCDKTRFIIVYKKNSNKILAYRCEYCGYSVFVKEKVKRIVRKEKMDQIVEKNVFKCPLGGVENCILEACSFYGNICKLNKK